MSHVFWPARPQETDDEARLREAVNRHCNAALSTLDAAMRMRTAGKEAQRMRARAKNFLVDFAATAAHSYFSSQDR